MLKAIFLIALVVSPVCAASYSCSSGTFVAMGDLVLNGTDTIDFTGTCIVLMQQRKIVITSTTWIGGHVNINTSGGLWDCGIPSSVDGTTPGTLCFGDGTAENYGFVGAGSYVYIQNTTLRRCNYFHFFFNSSDTSSVTSFKFIGNTVLDDAAFAIVPSANDSRYWMYESSTNSTSLKIVQGNKIYKGPMIYGSQGWTIGAASACSLSSPSTCDSQANIMAGPRAGVQCHSSLCTSYVAWNYIHDSLDVTPAQTFWSQSQNLLWITSTSTAEYNLFHTGHWVTEKIDGQLRYNVITEVSGHEFAETGSGNVHHNIMLGQYPAGVQYTDTTRQEFDSLGVLTLSGDAMTVYNNTIDARGRAVRALAGVSSGSTIAWRNNAGYQINLGASPLRASVGGDGACGSPPNRATYLDYNFFNYDAASATHQAYCIAVSGLSLCDANFGQHDVGGCPNPQAADPLFRGPLPIGKTVYTGGTPTGDSGFPFNDSDIIAGTYKVSDLLTYFRYVYAPAASSPLLSAASDGGHIGAIQAADIPGSVPSIVSTNKRPMVHAGPSFTVSAGHTTAANLMGFIADDGLPSGTLTSTWSTVQGPQSCSPLSSCVTFGNASATMTSATVTTDGTYTFRLTATDGTLTSTGDVQILYGSLASHPRIWLTSVIVSRITTKAGASDADYLVTKTAADNYLTLSPPKMTITAATNANPVVFTITETVPWASGDREIVLGGGTGAWAATTSGDASITATRTGTNTFSVPINSTGFGSFSGQDIIGFYADYNGVGPTSGLLGPGASNAEWLFLAYDLGVVFKATGTTSYQTKALEWLDYWNTLGAHGIYYMIKADSGRGDAGATTGLSIVYDWNYSGLSSGQKTASILTGRLWIDWCQGAGNGVCFSLDDPSNNYWMFHQQAIGGMGYAIFDEDPRLGQEWFNYTNAKWISQLTPLWSTPSTSQTPENSGVKGAYENGYLFNGSNYDINNVARYSKYVLMARSAANLDLLNGSPVDLNVFATYMMYHLAPDLWKSQTQGRWTGAWYGLGQQSASILLSEMLAGTSNGAYMEWQYENWGTLPGGAADYAFSPTTTYDKVMFYLASSGGRTATDYRSTANPYAFIDGTEALVQWRTGWATTDISGSMIVSQTVTSPSGGNPKHSGHIDLRRGADVLMTQSNYYMGTGDGTTGTPQMDGLTQAALASTFYLDNSANAATCFTGDAYTGCQTHLGIYSAPTVKLTSNYGFARSNLQSAYTSTITPQPVDYFFRSFLAMGNGAFVVWDQIHTPGATDIKQIRWQLSAANAPVTAGSMVSSVVGTSKLYVDSLLPVSPTLSVVHNQNQSAQDVNYVAKVSDPSPTVTFNALTVLFVTGSSTSLPTTTTLSTIDTNFVGVQIADTVPKVAVIPKNVTGSGPYSIPVLASSTFTSTHSGTGHYVVAGLAAGIYAITGPSSTSCTVGSDGTCYFTGASGAWTVGVTSAAATAGISSRAAISRTVVK